MTGGASEIVEIKTAALDERTVKVLKNVAANAFDLGFSFSGDSMQALAGAFIQLKVRFTSKGKYMLTVGGVNAYDSRRNKVEIAGASCPIEVY